MREYEDQFTNCRSLVNYWLIIESFPLVFSKIPVLFPFSSLPVGEHYFSVTLLSDEQTQQSAIFQTKIKLSGVYVEVETYE